MSWRKFPEVQRRPSIEEEVQALRLIDSTIQDRRAMPDGIHVYEGPNLQ
jgi:hypothetical protein